MDLTAMLLETGASAPFRRRAQVGDQNVQLLAEPRAAVRPRGGIQGQMQQVMIGDDVTEGLPRIRGPSAAAEPHYSDLARPRATDPD